VIIAAGGTGFFPFCDLIDLLFKAHLLETYPDLTETLLANDPILKDHPFANFSFTIYLALINMDDLHPLTLAQLNELSKHPKLVRLMLKLSSKRG
jgi:hypothetical protein